MPEAKSTPAASTRWQNSTKPLCLKLGAKAGMRLCVTGLPPALRAAFVTEGVALEEGWPAQPGAGDVLLAFAAERAAVAALAATLAPIAQADVRLWVAYPKGNKTDFNRDTGWQPFAGLGLRGVQQVALDGTWSALRFRPEGAVGT